MNAHAHSGKIWEGNGQMGLAPPPYILHTCMHYVIDSPEHQLFSCPELREESWSQLLDVLNSTEDYRQQLLTSTNPYIHRCFIERLRFLKTQHKLHSDELTTAALEQQN